MTSTIIRVMATALLIIVPLVLLVYKFLIYKKKQQRISASVRESRHRAALNKRYFFYKDFVLTRKHIATVYRQVSRLAIYSARDCRINTADFFEKSIIVSVALIILVAVTWHDILAVLLAIGLAMVLETQLVYARVAKVDSETLSSLRSYVSSFLDAYTNFANIPLALHEASCPPLLQNRIDAIYQVVTGDNGRGRLNIFLQETTNRTLKTIAVACYCHNEAGDGDDTSKFKNVMRMVKEELDTDYSIEIRRAIMFRGLTFLPLIPVVLFPSLKLILGGILPGTKTFYVSQIGYLGLVLVMVVCLFCYYVIGNMNNASVARTDDRMAALTKLMQRPRVAKFAKSLIPKKFSQRRKLQKQIDGCLSSKTIEYISLERLVFGVAIALFGFFATFVILFSARVGIKNTLVSPSMTSNLSYTKEEQAKMLEYDNSVLNMSSLPDADEIYKSVRTIMRKENDSQLNAQVQRIQHKYASYNAVRFRWWFAFFYIGLYFLGYSLPLYMLQLRAKLVQSEAEVDVLQLQTIIAVLMSTTLDTHSVLYWLMQTSETHRLLLEKCYYNFWADPMDALHQMKRKASIPEFRALCDRLMNTVYVCSIEEAFQDLVADRSLTLEIRKVKLLDAMSTKRRSVSKYVYAPTILCLLVVIMAPLFFVVAKSFVDVSSMMSFGN